MNSQQMIDHARRLAQLNKKAGDDFCRAEGPYTQACEFLRNYAGDNSSFHKSALELRGYTYDIRAEAIASILLSFAEYIEAGLKEEISPERRAQIDIVNDLLDQANKLIEDDSVHGAAPAVLIGATLEEFL